jgi:hypothetical protein
MVVHAGKDFPFSRGSFIVAKIARMASVIARPGLALGNRHHIAASRPGKRWKPGWLMTI